MFTKADCSKKIQIDKKKIQACLVPSRLVNTWLANTLFHLLVIWLQILVAIDSESRLTLFSSFCAPPCAVAVLFYLNLSSHTGRLFISAALHRILLGTCCFVPISYFYSETNE